ncbi:MAG: serine hydrolase domain-containing protein [Planctomycetota bacterium]
MLLTALLSGCASPSRVAEPPEPSLQVSEIVQQWMEERSVVGAAVSVSYYGHKVYSRGFGLADLEQNVPVDPARTKFRIGSVSKPLTAFALARLIERGRIDLDASIQTYVPSFPVKPEGAITSRQLAGHLAGIRHYRGDEFLSLAHYPNVLDGLAIFQNDGLLHPPDYMYSYSSYGYNLLSAAIEAAAGEPFLDHMQRVVFDAIGMDDTTADHVTPIVRHRSRYYVRDGETIVNAPPVDNSYKWAGGGFLSTSEDLLKFGAAHLTDERLHPETVQLLWESQTQGVDNQPTHYGLGWRSGRDSAGRRTVGHTGGSVGGSTVLLIYPEHQLVIALIANQSSARWGDTAERIASVYLER